MGQIWLPTPCYKEIFLNYPVAGQQQGPLYLVLENQRDSVRAHGAGRRVPDGGDDFPARLNCSSRSVRKWISFGSITSPPASSPPSRTVADSSSPRSSRMKMRIWRAQFDAPRARLVMASA